MPVRAKSALNLVDDQCDAGLLGDPAQTAQPLDVGRNHPALALHRFDDHRRWQLHAGLGIVEQVVQIAQIGLHTRRAAEAERATVVIRERHELHAVAEQCAQRLFRPQAAHQAQRALAHAVITAGERQHGAASGGRAHQFQCRFHGISTGGAAELDFRFARQSRWQQSQTDPEQTDP